MKPKSIWQWYNPPQDSLASIYCLNTSLHGLKHLAEKQLHICERLFWFAAVLASVSTAIFLIWRMWMDYNNMPIVTVMNPTEIKLEEIPFPSVTVCNVNIIRKSMVWKTSMEISNYNQGLPYTDKYYMNMAQMFNTKYICDTAFTLVDGIIAESVHEKLVSASKYDTLRNISEFKDYINPKETLCKMSQPCDELIRRCTWEGETQRCGDLFHSIETDYGYCCSFNTMSTSKLLNNRGSSGFNSDLGKNWGTESLDYETLLFMGKMKDRPYPERQRTAGKSSGLSFLLSADLDEYYCTSTDSKGFILGTNVPLDLPQLEEDAIAIPVNSEIFIGVRPEITMSDQSISGFHQEKRQCYYGNEFKLAHYKLYTIANCRSECVARKVYDECGCVPYYMPNNKQDALCNPTQYNCTRDKQKNIYKIGLTKVCTECLPTCTEIDYHEQVTSLPLQESKVESLLYEMDKVEQGMNLSIVHVYFNTNSVYPKLRKVVTTVPELLSNTGGLLGLCLGFSVLSLLEIFYYGTMRAFFRWYQRNTSMELDMDQGSNWKKQQCLFSKQANAALSIGPQNIPSLDPSIPARLCSNDVFVSRKDA